MTDKNNKLEKKPILEDIQNDMGEQFIDSMGDVMKMASKLKPMIGSVVKKIGKEMKEKGFLCVLRYNKSSDSPVFVLMKAKEILSFDTTEDAIQNAISLENLIQSILDGSIEEFFNT